MRLKMIVTGICTALCLMGAVNAAKAQRGSVYVQTPGFGIGARIGGGCYGGGYGYYPPQPYYGGGYYHREYRPHYRDYGYSYGYRRPWSGYRHDRGYYGGGRGYGHRRW